MYNSFDSENFKVQIGIRFDSQMEKLIEFAKAFSKNTGAGLRLTHAVEPWKDHSWLSTFPSEDLYMSVAKSVELQTLMEAKDRMKELAEGLSGFNVETNVAIGPSFEVLKADALASGCAMIIVSASDDETNYRVIPQGFSTALSLMNKSEVPVMVVPSQYKLDPHLDNVGFLCADDLTPRGSEALALSSKLSANFKKARIIHAHVCHESKDGLAKVGKKVLQWMTEGKIPYDENFKSENLTDQVTNQTGQVLDQRYRKALRTSGNPKLDYEQLVLFGQVQDELQAIVDEKKPDFIVFGRHEFIHNRPFGIGKIPMWAMFSFNRPILIAPPPELLLAGEAGYDRVRALTPTLVPST